MFVFVIFIFFFSGLVGEDVAQPDELEVKKMRHIFSQEIQVYKKEIQQLKAMIQELQKDK